MMVHEAFYETAGRQPEGHAVRAADGAVTYGALAERCRRLAGGLGAHGVRAGERAAILLENSVGFVEAYYAILTTGAAAVPIDPQLTPRNLGAALEDCDPVVVIVKASGLDAVADALHRLPRLRAVVLVPSGRMTAVGQVRVVGWEDLLRSAEPLTRPAEQTPEDLALILYTSGTTGHAKGVMLTHANLWAACSNIMQIAGITATDRELLTLPLSHLFGLAHVHCYLRAGGSLILRHGLLPIEALFQTMSQERVTSFPAVPATFAMLLQRFSPRLEQAAGGVRYMFTNSAPMPVDQIRQLRALLPRARLLMYYGLTEASRATFLDYAQAAPEQFASVGPAAPGVEVEIYNEQGTRCPVGREGEIVIRGPTVTPGYWRRPQETAQALRREGLRTGDLGRLDAEGFLFVTGRLKDLINAGGMKFSPAEIETVLSRHAAVREVAVAGIPDPAGVMGEVVKAYVVPDPSQSISPEILRQFAMQSLEPYKVPSVIQFVQALPKTEAGKLKRAQLHDFDPQPSVRRL